MREKLLTKFYDSGLARKAFRYYVGAWTTVTSRVPIGTNIFEREWDTLIVLDTCRVDALKEVKDEYEFITDVDKIVSVGSTSNEWMANTFTSTYIDSVNSTAYLSANGYSSRVFKERRYPEVHMGTKHQPPSWVADEFCYPEDFLLLDQIWEYAPQDSPGHTLPEYVMDRAVNVGRSLNPEHLVVHFNQPHAPYIADAIGENRELKEFEQSPFESLRQGTDRDQVWEAYIENLRMVLDQVEVLLDNHSAEKVVITADHGEAFGEWGMYGHLPGMIHPHVKIVPWVTTKGDDKENYQPELEQEHNSERDTESQLRALGYK
ncbi:alkaline phosphatase family protein [Haloferax volcanii]|uniref:Sulfatase-like hydrolase/transferase n=1 Tax=Haloferax volcanii TaxID=2246 RepID=A0A847TX66_HALVO|nr:hypothetical protein [Haloferax alexandrinus]NLV03628.1 hypothetical protein [Haloferax alexandrinus]